MPDISRLLLLSALLPFVVAEANASEAIAINPTDKAALLDGRCGKDRVNPGHGSSKIMLDSGYLILGLKIPKTERTLNSPQEHTGKYKCYATSSQVTPGT